MTYVALASVATVALTVLAFTGLLLKQERRHSRRVDNLLDRLAHAHGKTWTPPPADNGDESAPVIDSYDPFQTPV